MHIEQQPQRGAKHDRLLTIGEVAARTGLAPSALRYYEIQGLISPDARVGGKRRYRPEVLRDLALVECATQAGFTLAEARELIEAARNPREGSQQWEELAARKHQELEETIQQARTMQRLLHEGPFSVRRAGGRWGFPSPFAYRRGPGLVQASLLFDTLVWKDPGGRLRPWLAESWQQRADATAYRFVLREGVRWADGTPLTAADVAFTVGYLACGPGRAAHASHARELDVVEDATAQDERTVELRLRHPYAAFLERVAGRMLIVPRHIWADVNDPVRLRQPEAAVGTGPYRLDACDEEAGSYRFTAREDYFLGAPTVKRLEFVPTRDPLGALAEGEIDVAEFLGDAQRPSDKRLAAFAAPEYVVTTHPGEWTRALHVNLARGFPYDEPRFRHALAHAIDRHALIDRLLDGQGEPASPGGLAPSHPSTEPDLPTYAFDPSRARALLDELGLHQPPGAAMRMGPDGAAPQPVLHTDVSDPGAAELIAGHLATVGVSARVVRLPVDVADEHAAAADYDLALVGHGGLGADPDVLRVQLSSHVATGGRLKAHAYHSPEFERVASDQASCLDPGRRAELVSRLQRIIADDLPIVPLYVPSRIKVGSRRRVFDAWHYTPGGVIGGMPGSLNKQALIGGDRGSWQPEGWEV